MAEPAKTADAEDGLVIDIQNLPAEHDAGLGERARIGVIVLTSDQTIEHEFRKMLDLPGVAFYESRIPNAQEINHETLAAMEQHIPDCTRVIMPGARLDVVAFGCTSGAMVIGDETVRARIHEVRPGIPTTSPIAAAFAAFEALDARRICLVAPYIDPVNRSMRAYIRNRGFEVPVMASWNIEDDDKVARITPASIRDAVCEVGKSDLSDMVFVSCSSLRVAEQVEMLEAEIGKPVTSSNHAMAWHCLRLAGYHDPVGGFGRLFRTGLA
ncbi:MAG: Asp/Glu racemase [Alphaproteobacteria bacterium]|nr:Asp/Glu racemase [Alphaproteobacteria bacterium]